MLQFFHWYHPGNLWNEFSQKAEELARLGFTAVWLPPAHKCHLGTEGRGYDVYDMYDLGEFDQKNGVATRYGSKEEYVKAIEDAHLAGLSVYADVVLNHRIGADAEETVTVHQVADENRNQKISKAFQAEAPTKFTFPGRNGKYSDFVWDYQCFSGIDNIKRQGKTLTGIFKIHNDSGTEWTEAVSHQLGNYDYLMGADVEYRNPEVVQEMKNWIAWFLNTTKADGMRLDALKHINSDFLKSFIRHVKTNVNPECYVVGEYWVDDAEKMAAFTDETDSLISCFDVPLHYRFFQASEEGQDFDLRTLSAGSFLEERPALAVTFVENHDTQRLQALESAVQHWFKPLAYAFILLSENGYPCVFYPDLYGAEYSDTVEGKDIHVVMPKVEMLPKLLEARTRFGHGRQVTYFDDSYCIALVREGTADQPGCVMIMSNAGASQKKISLGNAFANAVFTDYLNIRKEVIRADADGNLTAAVNERSVSVWVLRV